MSENSSNSSHYSPYTDCIFEGHIYYVLFFNNLVLLPLTVFILHLGFQRWKQQRSVSSAAAMSISDFITYNIAVMELIGTVGYTISFFSYCVRRLDMLLVGSIIGSFPWSGQMIFPIMTCVESYLAAVHPITYLSLRKVNGNRIRNISTGYVWLQCFAGMGLMFLMTKRDQFNLILNISLTALLLITTTFCNLSVLCILIRPRPGAAGRDRVRCNQSKQRALHTIIIIMGVLWVRFGGNLACSLVKLSSVSHSVQCVLISAAESFNLPSSLLLPLLFLHRAGKLPGWTHNTEPG